MASGSVFEALAGRATRLDDPFIAGAGAVTYGELLAAADRLAAKLKARGLARGGRVAVCLDQGLEYVASLLGIWKGGGVSVLMAPDWTPREKERVIEHSGAALILADMAPASQSARLDDFDGLECSLFSYPAGDATPCEPGDAVIIYTSGTTGEPKGVVLTERGITANVAAVAEYLAIEAADRVPIFTPTCYAYSLSQNLVQASRGGAILPVPSGLMFPMDVLHAIATYSLTGFSATPTACRILCNLALDTDARYDSVRFVMCGGQFLDVGLVRLIESVFPRARVVNMYGCTENSPRIAYQYVDEPGSADEHGYFPVGRPVRGTDVRVMGEGGLAAPGEIGEVVIRGTSLMRAYWRDEATTAERLRDGWFHTRDLGYVDAMGRLHLTGRQSTIINVGNEKVSPEEVEKVLLEFPGVVDAAVYGRPDRLLGEAVEAQLVLDDSARTLLSDIQRHCRDRISGYKVPRRFVTVNAIPRTLYGKIDRARLRDAARDNVEA